MTQSITVIITIIAILAACAAIAIYIEFKERKEWNNGRCIHCNRAMKYKGMQIDLSEGYYCKHCSNWVFSTRYRKPIQDPPEGTIGIMEETH